MWDNAAAMIIKAALLMWLVAFVLMLISNKRERTWMMGLAWAGLCLLLAGLLIKVVKI
jgi:hypothetical protein